MPRARSQLKAQERALIHWLALELEPVEVHVDPTENRARNPFEFASCFDCIFALNDINVNDRRTQLNKGDRDT